MLHITARPPRYLLISIIVVVLGVASCARIAPGKTGQLATRHRRANPRSKDPRDEESRLERFGEFPLPGGDSHNDNQHLSVITQLELDIRLSNPCQGLLLTAFPRYFSLGLDKLTATNTNMSDKDTPPLPSSRRLSLLSNLRSF